MKNQTLILKTFTVSRFKNTILSLKSLKNLCSINVNHKYEKYRLKKLYTIR